MLDLFPQPDQRMARRICEASGLFDVQGMWLGGNYATCTALVRLGVDPDSGMEKTFPLHSTKRRFASFIPQNAWSAGSVSVKSGTDTWDAFSEYLYGLLHAADEVDSRSEFREGMAEFKEAMNVAPGDIAAIVADVGWFVGGGPRNPRLASFLRVTDRKAAEELLAGVAASRAFRRHRASRVQAGEREIHVLGRDFCYVMIEDVVRVGPKAEVLAAVVEAHDQRQSQAESSAYRQLAKCLPDVAGARVFYHLGEMLTVFSDEIPPLGVLLAKHKDHWGKLVLGATLTTTPGLFEVHIAAPKPGESGPVLSRAVTKLWRQSRAPERVLDDASNLKQLALGVLMYMGDSDGNYPPALGEVSPYVRETGVFRCPTSRQPAPKDATAIDSGDCDYIYLKPARAESDVQYPSREPLILTRPGLLPDDGMNVAYADGHVKWHSIQRLPERVRRALEKHHGGDWLRKLQVR